MPDPSPALHRLVRASAGTGKTFALTTRYLALLRAGVDPTTILATTFTRKAAGEVFQRVLTRLSQAVLDPQARKQLDQQLLAEGLFDHLPPLDQDAAADMLRRLTQRLDRAAIGTIDGFFARLCAAFALELQLPLDPNLTDDGSALAAELRESAIDSMLGAAANDNLPALLTLLRQLHHDTAKRSVTASLDHIFRGDADGFYATYRQARQPDQWADLPAQGMLNPQDLQQLIAQLGDAEPLLPRTKAGQPNARWGNALGKDLGHAHAGRWEAILKAGLAKAALTTGDYFNTPFHPQLLELCESLGQHAEAQLIQKLNQQHQATFQLLDRFATHFEDRCKNQRVLLFADLTDRLAQHLRQADQPHTHPNAQAWRDELTYRLDGRVEHLLIDEFQDTSVDQFAVLWPLIDEATADQSDNKTLFVVGDAKQSIYGWRGGRVELFDDLGHRVKPRGLQHQTLDHSYRSSAAILDAVNQVFETLPQTDAWPDERQAIEQFAATYQTHHAAKHLPGEVLLKTTQANGDPHDQDLETDVAHPETLRPPTTIAHADAVAKHVAQLVEQHPTATIGILVRTNAQAGQTLHALRQANVPASGETGVALTDHPAVGVALSAFRLADHPGDTIAAHHVAQSPLGVLLGLESTHPKHTHRVAAQLRRDLVGRGFAAVLAEWAVQLAPACDHAALRRLQQLANLAEQYQPITPLRAQAFVRFVEKARVEDPSTDRVRVMTIHRAKGLEFDIAVLPHLHGKLTFKPILLEERQGDTGPVAHVYRAGDQALRDRIPTLHDLYIDTRSRWAYEQLCTLYVALTRAKHATHILCPPATPSDPRAAKTLLAPVLHGLVDEAADLSQADNVLYQRQHEGGLQQAFEPTQQHDASPPSSPLQREWPVSRKSDRVPTASSSPTPTKSNPRTIQEALGLATNENADKAATQFGTAAHAYLQQLAFLDPDTPQPALPEDAHLADHLQAALQSSDFREALAERGAAQLRTELPLLFRDAQGQPTKGVIDRLVWWTDAKGQPTRAEIQDFKTDRPPPDIQPSDLPPFNAWLAARAQHHRPQLDAYRAIAAGWLDLPEEQVVATLLFTTPGRCVHL